MGLITKVQNISPAKALKLSKHAVTASIVLACVGVTIALVSAKAETIGNVMAATGIVIFAAALVSLMIASET